jgi:effector-binding domain-containing protein
MLDKPHIAQAAAQRTAVIRLTIPRAEIRNVMGPGYRELTAAVAAQGIAPVGPWFTHHFRMDPEIFDFEIGVPVAAPIAAAGRVQPGELPAATVARAVYPGPYEGLAAAWGEFGAWIAAEGYATAQNLWERYVAGPESSPDPATWRTELNRPLVRKGPRGAIAMTPTDGRIQGPGRAAGEGR